MKKSVSLALLTVIIFLGLLFQYYYLGAQAVQSKAATTVGEVEVPTGYMRQSIPSDSFGEFLRNLPLKDPVERILLYNGNRKLWQHALYQVIDLPIGDQDLQQCADVAIRLYSDFLYFSGKSKDISFKFTSGDEANYQDWINGMRPAVSGNDVNWYNCGVTDSSIESYRKYLETVFTYAGSYSLARDMKKVDHYNNIRIGDCFIIGGFPGHVVIVMDLAIDSIGNKAALIGQGFTPAQDIHLVRNLENNTIDPWYILGESDKLITPEWTFDWSDIYRFGE